MARQTEIEKLERRYEEKPTQWFAALAEEYRRAGDVDQALAIVRKGLEQRSSYVSGHVVLARCLLQQNNDGEAEQVLKQVLELDSENIIALKVLSEIKERANDSVAALEWLEKLLEVDPMNQDAHEAVERLRPPAPAEVDAGAPEQAVAPDEPQDDVADEAATGKMTAVEFDEAGLSDPEPAEEMAVGAAETPADELVVLDTIPGDPGDTVGEAVAVPEGAGGGGEAPVETPPADVAATESVPALPWDAAGPEPAASVPDPEPEPMAAEVEHDPPAEVSSEAAAPGLPAGLVEHPVAAAEPAKSPVDAPSAEPHVAEIEPPEAIAAEPVQEAVPDAAGFLPVEAVPEAIAAEPVQEAVPDAAGPLPIEAVPEATAAEPEPEPEPEAEPEPEPATVAESEPEPVVTETMADVYVSQGLYAEAGVVYQQLLDQRPDDAGLQAKLADLGRRGGREETSVERPESAPVQVFAAMETGGLSARAFLTGVLAATVGTPSRQASPDHASAGAATPAEAAPTLPEEPSPLEAAFDAPEPAVVDLPGEPTQPATDSPSLAAVFDETPGVPDTPSPPLPPSPSPVPNTEQPDGEPIAKDGEMSFDEFFGDGQEPPPTGEPPDPTVGQADDVREDGEFKDWLKGLKT